MSKVFPPFQQREMSAERSEEARTVDKGHGRVECRTLISSSMLNDFLNWPGVKQVCRVVRTITRGGKTTTEVEYALTSVEMKQADAWQLLEWWRGHWVSVRATGCLLRAV